MASKAADGEEEPLAVKCFSSLSGRSETAWKKQGKKEQKNYLAVVLVLNIGVLFFFKYLGFFVNDIFS